MKNSKFKVQCSVVKLCWLILLLSVAACTVSKQETPTGPSGGGLSTPTVSVESGTFSTSPFKVKVYVENVSDLYDAGFVMSYNAAVATPTTNATVTTSWALAQDGTSNMSYVLTNNQPTAGKFTVGVSRSGSTLSGIDITSKTLLCEIEFQKVAAGSLNLSIDTSSAYLQHTTLNDFVSGVTWTNGTITVQ